MNIFITGATGFVGGVLVSNLVERGHHIYILARSETKAKAVLENLNQKNQGSVDVIFGDIRLPDLGLSQESLVQLKDKIDVVYHMAALVKFDKALEEELYQINYTGTKHTLEFAEKLGLSSFFYISTAYTLGSKEEGREELHSLDGPFQNPYEETKCRAEHLVFSYQDRMDVSIFRPAIIVGDSRTGKADSSFAMYGFMRGLEVFSKRMSRRSQDTTKKYYLMGNANGTSNIVPVDYVCMCLTEAISYAQKNHIYHITNPNAPANYVLLSLMKEHLAFDNIDVISEEMVSTLTQEDLLLHDMIGVFQHYLSRDISFTDDNMQQLLLAAGQKPLDMDLPMLRRIILGYNSDSEPIDTHEQNDHDRFADSKRAQLVL